MSESAPACQARYDGHPCQRPAVYLYRSLDYGPLRPADGWREELALLMEHRRQLVEELADIETIIAGVAEAAVCEKE